MNPIDSFAGRASMLGIVGLLQSMTRPHEVAEFVHNRAKLFAKHAKRRLEKSHSACLEAVARASGAKDWHSFQTVLTDIACGGDGEQLDAFVSCLGMVIYTRGSDVHPTPRQLEAQRDFASRFATQVGTTQEMALEIVAATCGASSWIELTERDPMRSEFAFISFASEGRDGQFIRSPACEQVRDRFEDEEPSKKVLEDLIRQQPSFLDAYEALGYQLELTSYKEALKVYREGVKAGDLLLAGFKGRLSWYRLENRSYLTLLYRNCAAALSTSRYAEAIKLARKSLRFNPSDNTGTRYYLMTAQIANEDYEAAAKTMASMRKGSEIRQEVDTRYLSPVDVLLGAAVHHGMGNKEQALKDAALAHFKAPYLLDLIEADEPFRVDQSQVRGVMHDETETWLWSRNAVWGNRERHIAFTRVMRSAAEIEKRELQPLWADRATGNRQRWLEMLPEACNQAVANM